MIHADDERFNDIDRAEAVLAEIDGIPNDGGGW